MTEELAHFQILGIDLVVYLGVTALLLLIFAALINSLNEHVLLKRGKFIPPIWHHRLAILAISIIFIHVVIQYIPI